MSLGKMLQGHLQRALTTHRLAGQAAQAPLLQPPLCPQPHSAMAARAPLLEARQVPLSWAGTAPKTVPQVGGQLHLP